MSIKKKKRSGLEESLAPELEANGFEYESCKLDYQITHSYTPDFVLTPPDDRPKIHVEVKGYFRPGDTQKYRAINKSLLFDELVFFLQYPNKKIKKGAKMTMSQWCEKEGIAWFDTVEELIDYANA